MAIVTFTSDFGLRDHYVAAIKAILISQEPSLNIIDISHSIAPLDMAHMAFVVRSVFRDFPEGSIHLLGMNASQAQQDAYLAAKIENHYFIGPNNGIISLLSDKDPELVVKFQLEESGIFPLKKIIAQHAQALLSGADLTQMGNECTDYVQMLLRQPRATKREISGHVIYVDHFGNLITNIKKLDFDILSRNREYTIHFGKEKVRRVHQNYFDVEPGDACFIFNSQGVLEIGLNEGNAAMLLGLGHDSPISIKFDE